VQFPCQTNIFYHPKRKSVKMQNKNSKITLANFRAPYHFKDDRNKYSSLFFCGKVFVHDVLFGQPLKKRGGDIIFRA